MALAPPPLPLPPPPQFPAPAPHPDHKQLNYSSTHLPPTNPSYKPLQSLPAAPAAPPSPPPSWTFFRPPDLFQSPTPSDLPEPPGLHPRQTTHAYKTTCFTPLYLTPRAVASLTGRACSFHSSGWRITTFSQRGLYCSLLYWRGSDTVARPLPPQYSSMASIATLQYRGVTDAEHHSAIVRSWEKSAGTMTATESRKLTALLRRHF